MPGRPRKPTPLHLIDGHAAKVAAREENGEPPAQAVVLACPDYLDDAEKAEWKYFAELAGTMKVTTNEDAAAMEVLATSSAAAKELRDIIRKLRADGGDGDGDNAYEYETITKGTAMKRVRPVWSILQELDRKILLTLGRFGLTPSDRSKVKQVEGAPSSDGDAEFTS